MKNGLIIVGYSGNALLEGNVNVGKGFLGSISNRKVFYLKRNVVQAQLTQYNPYYIIFGNAELRIKLGVNIAESNLGIAGKYFDTGAIKNPSILFGTEDNAAEL